MRAAGCKARTDLFNTRMLLLLGFLVRQYNHNVCHQLMEDKISVYLLSLLIMFYNLVPVLLKTKTDRELYMLPHCSKMGYVVPSRHVGIHLGLH